MATERLDVLAVEMGKKMRRWSAVKLEKEAMFAAACNDGSDECEAWHLATTREQTRREQAAAKRIGGAA